MHPEQFAVDCRPVAVHIVPVLIGHDVSIKYDLVCKGSATGSVRLGHAYVPGIEWVSGGRVLPAERLRHSSVVGALTSRGRINNAGLVCSNDP